MPRQTGSTDKYQREPLETVVLSACCYLHNTENVHFFQKIEHGQSARQRRFLFELQSSNDFTMPFRLLVYMTAIWLDYFKNSDTNERKRQGYRLPMIMPMILYKGEWNWTAARRFREMIGQEGMFGKYVVDFEYAVVSVNSLAVSKIKSSNTLVDNILLADKKSTRREWDSAENIELVRRIKAMEMNDLNEWITWFSHVIRELGEEEKKGFIQQLREGDERVVSSSFERIMEKEKIEGKAEGKAEAVIELLEDIGEPSETLKKYIMSQKDIAVLRSWLKAASKAGSIEEFEQAIGIYLPVIQLQGYNKRLAAAVIKTGKDYKMKNKQKKQNTQNTQNVQTGTFQNATGAIDYTLMNDCMFHIVMQSNEKVLRGLVCALLRLTPEEVQSITVLNPIELGRGPRDKEYILDVKVLLNSAAVINIELQVRKQDFWDDRSLSYLCRLFGNLESGDDYSDVMPTYHIGILDFTLFPEYPEFYATNKMMNVKKHYIYNDKFTLNVLELNQIELATDEDKKWKLDYWARLFKAKTWEELKMLAQQDTVFMETCETIYQKNQDDVARLWCEASEEAARIARTVQKIHEKALAERDAVIVEQETKLIKKDNELEENRQQLEENRQQLEENRQQLTEQEKKLAEKDAELERLRCLLAKTNGQH